MKKKFLSILCAATVATTMFTGCSKSTGKNETSGNGKNAAQDSKESTQLTDGVEGEAVTKGEADTEVHVALNAAPSTLDCTLTSALVTKQIAYSNIFESLVTMKSDYSVAPELAESYEVSDDHTEYTYHLRKGVLFHNGDEMKASDVVASMNRWVLNYGNAQALVGDSKFEAVDDYTVKITLKTPSIFLNELIAGAGNMPIIVPEETLETLDSETGALTEFIGTGPYKFEEWKTDQYIKLTKNENYQPYGNEGQYDGYWGYKEAKIPAIYYDIVTDDATRVAGLQTGEYDFAYKLPVDNYDTFSGQENYIIYKEVAGYPALVYNKKEGIASNPLVRQGINAALNDEDIMKAAYADENFYRLDGSLMIQEQKQWYTEAGTENYNLNDSEKALSLLKEAGAQDETFRILVTTDYQEFYNAAIVIQQQLETIGVKCDVDACDWATFLEKRADSSAYDAFITSFTTNPIPTLLSYYNSEWAGWVSDKEVLQGVSDFNSAATLEDAKKVWENLQKFTIGDGAEISKFGDYQLYSVSSTKLSGLNYFQGPLFWSAQIYK